MALTRPRAYQIYDIDYKQATRVITVSNITLSGGAPSQVDGVSLTLKDRVLVTGQTNKAQNGIYYVTTVGSGSNGTWSRSIDTDTTGELLAGTIVMVTEGLVYADSQWKLTTDDPIVIGVSELIFEQNSAFAFGNVYANGTAVLASSVGDVLTLSAGNNISITGNNTGKTVTIGVTGISLNSISNGTSNVNVVSSGGNVTVGINGTSNVAVFGSAGANITGTLGVSGNVTGGNISTAGQVIATGNITGANLTVNNDAVITGNLTVNGTTTTINSNTITTNDKNIVVANNQSTGANVDGAGIDAGGGTPIATWRYNNATTSWQSNISITPSANGTLSLGGASNYWGNAFLTTASIAGNVTGGNIDTTGQVVATGNITAGNLKTSAVTISSTGAVSGITTISATGNANVGNLSATTVVATTLTGTLSTASQPNITSVGTLGSLTVTGNISGGNILGNGAGLTGINAFGTIAVSGQSDVVADSTSDTLTLAAGSGIAITTVAGTDTITIASVATDSIFATGGDMGTITDAVTTSEDLGTTTSAVTVSYDLGTETTGGIVTPSLLLLPSYTVAELGSLNAAPAGQFVYCTNEGGGAVPAFSDGTNWRRVTDRAIVS